MITTDEAERIAILMEANHLNESAAIRLHKEQTFAMQIAENHYQAKVARLRSLVERPKPISVPRHEPIVDRKSLAAGEQ